MSHRFAEWILQPLASEYENQTFKYGWKSIYRRDVSKNDILWEITIFTSLVFKQRIVFGREIIW